MSAPPPRLPPRRRAGQALSLLAALGVSLSSAPGRADDVDQLFERGRTLHREGKYAEAKAAYEQVLARGGPKHAVALCNLGGAERDLEQWVESATHLAACLGVPELDKTRASVIDKALDSVRAKVLSVRVEGVPDGAELVVVASGVSRGLGKARRLFVAADVEVSLQLRVGTTTLRRTVRGSGGAEVAVTWTAPAAEAPTAPAPPGPRSPGWKVPLALALGAVGLAGAGVGGALLGLSAAKDAEGDELRGGLVVSGLCPAVDPTACERLLGLRKEQDLFFNAGVPLLVAGGVLAVGGLVVGVVPVGGGPKAALTLGPGGAGLRASF